MNEDGMSLVIQGETLLLHAERAVVWPARGTVIVADTHFGKSAVFGHHGFAVPAGSDELDRERLTRLLRSTQSRRLIILGDFLHGPIDADSKDARDLELWCRSLADVEIQVIAGNHDRGVLQRWQPPVRWRQDDLLEAPFRFTHDADRLGSCDVGPFTFSGHVHPVVRLGGLRKRAPRVPVFWQRRGGLVLPSFGLFTGGYAVSAAVGDSLFAVGSERVVRFR